MNRWALRILLFLLLGAIVNVAVAWGCARGDLVLAGNDPTIARPLEWLHAVPEHWPPVPVHGGTSRALGSMYSFRSANGHPASLPAFFQQGVLCTGLPVRSMERELLLSMQGPASMTRTWKAAFDGSRIGLDEDWFPLRPIWPGFAINTVFYGVVLWLLLAGPFVLRRWRRIRRGLCPKCAYDLRGGVGTPACPECGAAASTMAVTQSSFGK